MSRQWTAPEKPTLEEVRQRFEQWRKHRKQRTPIPESLWEGAVRLCADHSLCKVSSSLRLDYRVLKRRVCSSRPGGIPESMTSSDFIALDLNASLPECNLEMERDGATMRMHRKGVIGVYPLALMKACWGQGR